MRQYARSLAELAVLVALLVPAATAAQSDTLSVEKKIAGLSLVWQEANYNFAFFDNVPDLDWNAEFEAAIVKVMATPTDYAYIRAVQRFVALLGEAHTNLEPGKAFRAAHGGHPAVELEEIERRAVVVNTSTSLAGNLPLGSVIWSIDGIPVESYLCERVFPYMSASTTHYLWRQSIRGHKWRAVGLLVGDVGSTVTVAVETARGDRLDIALERLPHNAEIEWQHPPREKLEALEFRRLDDGILYFALNTFNTPDIVPEFEKHLEALEDAKAVILDIRNNGGGNSRHGWNIGRYFSDVPLAASRWKTRTHLAAYKAWGKFSKDPEKKLHYQMNAWDGPDEPSMIDPADRHFIVPLAILIGASTYSAAEDFLSFMRAVPHAVFVGEPTAGSTGQPLTFQIPGGAWVGITSKHDTMPDGTEFVGLGVQPDALVDETLDAHRAGRDLVLERAIDVLKERMR